MKTTTYYVLSMRYAGPPNPLDCYVVLDCYIISSKPARTDADGKPYDRGWFDVMGERAVGAHGTYSALDSARKAIQALAPGARPAREGEIDFRREGAVEY